MAGAGAGSGAGAGPGAVAPPRGAFLLFEGPDRSGKSTQTRCVGVPRGLFALAFPTPPLPDPQLPAAVLRLILPGHPIV